MGHRCQLLLNQLLDLQDLLVCQRMEVDRIGKIQCLCHYQLFIMEIIIIVNCLQCQEVICQCKGVIYLLCQIQCRCQEEVQALPDLMVLHHHLIFENQD